MRRSQPTPIPTSRGSKGVKQVELTEPMPKRQRNGSQDSTRSGSPPTGSGEKTPPTTERNPMAMNEQHDANNSQTRNQTTHNFLLKQFDPKFKTPKQVLLQLQKYVPRANITEIVFTRNGIVIKSPDINFANVIRNKASTEIFGPQATLQQLSSQAKKQPPPPKRPPQFSAVIRGVPPDYTEQEVEDELKYEGYEISRCLRIKNDHGPTFMVRVLTGSKDTIDDLLSNGAFIYRRRHRVEPSKTTPTLPIRCEKCQSYNQHPTNKCPNLPNCGYCSENHLTTSCPNLQGPPKCSTCAENHPTYSYKCKAKPKPVPEHPELTVPLRTSDTQVTPNNSLRDPVTIEDLIRFSTILLQNVHPFLRDHILTQTMHAAKVLFNVQFHATYSGPHVHFNFNSIETAV